MVSAVNEQLLDERLAALEEARAWSPRLISKLESHIRTADDLALFRINAFSFAQERHLPENEIIDLFLQPFLAGLVAVLSTMLLRGRELPQLEQPAQSLSLPVLPGRV